MTPNTIPEPSTLSDALILASTGGFLDSFVYLNHGHVFANSMTGNVALLGIALLGHGLGAIIPHLVPILGFFVGVISARHLHARSNRAPIVALTFEIVTLFILGWMPPGFPDIPFTAIVAFVAAFQVSSFRHVNQLPFNSTFVTGNLRQATEGLYDALNPLPHPKPAKAAASRSSTSDSSASASSLEPLSEHGPRPTLPIAPSGSPNRCFSS
jgi:uncharacterized membrane protein YoaK (UPF0700 family)